MISLMQDMKKMEGHVFRMYDTNSDGNHPFGNWLLAIGNC